MLNRTIVVVIHDSMETNDPLIVSLGEVFEDQNVVLFKKPTQGLDFIFSNLGKKLIVILDLDLGSGEPNGIEILARIRNHTSLVHVIIFTAKQLSGIPATDLITLINNDAMAVLQSTDDIEVVLSRVRLASHRMDTRVDCVLEQWILNRPEEFRKSPFFSLKGREYSLADLVVEIRKETELGSNVERMVMQSAVAMFTKAPPPVSS